MSEATVLNDKKGARVTFFYDKEILDFPAFFLPPIPNCAYLLK